MYALAIALLAFSTFVSNAFANKEYLLLDIRDATTSEIISALRDVEIELKVKVWRASSKECAENHTHTHRNKSMAEKLLLQTLNCLFLVLKCCRKFGFYIPMKEDLK